MPDWTILDELYLPGVAELPSRSEPARYACPAGGWKPAAVQAVLDELLERGVNHNGAKRTTIGHSVEGRPIDLIEVGHGSRRVLAWSQMHGNEPTHTTALLELLRLFMQPTGEADAENPLRALLDTIIAGCTLGLVVMLNPDGAVRNIRFNAHGIDINRDAKRLAAPESRVLKELVETFKPAFGLNLHNQHHRTATAEGQQPCAVSLLAPPRAVGDPQTPTTEQAAKLAALLSQRLSPHCEGRLSRYDADYMPRAFGEWVQGQDVATVLIESGGWPGAEFEPLDRLHLFALVTAFEAIATDAYESVDPQTYVELPRSGEFDLYDLVVRNANVHFNPEESASQIDIGINFPKRAIGNATPGGGTVVDLGDLSVHGSVDSLHHALQQASHTTALPGHWEFAAGLHPGCDSQELEQELLAQGVTTVIGAVDLASDEQLVALETEPLTARYRLNRGMIATLGDPSLPTELLCERLLRAIASGVLGVEQAVLAGMDKSLQTLVQRYRLPTLDLTSWRATGIASHQKRFARSRTLATELGLGDRHAITRGGRADLLLLGGELSEEVAAANLQLVLVGGTVGWSADQSTNVSTAEAGDYLCRWHTKHKR